MSEPLTKALTLIDAKCDAPREVATPLGDVVVYSRPPAGREHNEDAAAILPVSNDCCVLAVADGVGGAKQGQLASEIVIRELNKALKGVERDGLKVRAAILNGLESANARVLAEAAGAATTVALVDIRKESLRSYHVGDSVILQVGQRGALKLETVAHSPVGFALEAGLLDRAEAMHHEDRHLVSNVIGDDEMRIEIGSRVPLAVRDTVLLASDGLFDNLHFDEIVGYIRKGPLLEAAERIAEHAQQRMQSPTEGMPSKPDDLTFVIFRPDTGERV